MPPATQHPGANKTVRITQYKEIGMHPVRSAGFDRRLPENYNLSSRRVPLPFTVCFVIPMVYRVLSPALQPTGWYLRDTADG